MRCGFAGGLLCPASSPPAGKFPMSAQHAGARGLTMQGRAASSLPVRIVYGCYAWMALLIASTPVALAMLVTPGVLRRRQVARLGARAFFLLIGSRIRTLGGSLPASASCVVVANHASYLDGIILTAALPARFTYVIKKEMTAVPLAGFVLKRLGSEFVQRDDVPQLQRTARRLLDAAAGGKALAFFPEGTFEAEPGLKPFRAGAFRTAWRGGADVVPVVILGSRRKLPAGAWLASPGPLAVRVCAALPARDHESADGLMRAARQAMLKHLDEPDLAASPVSTDPTGSPGRTDSTGSPDRTHPADSALGSDRAGTTDSTP